MILAIAVDLVAGCFLNWKCLDMLDITFDYLPNLNIATNLVVNDRHLRMMYMPKIETPAFAR